MKIAIFSNIWPEAISQLKSKHDCLLSVNPEFEEKKEMIKNAEIVILRSPVKLDKQTLDAAKNLELVIRAGMGLDAINVQYAKKIGIKIVIVPLSSESVAEHILGLILSLYRHIPWFHQSLKENRWEKHAFLSNDIFGKTLGLCGFGRIGIRMAEIAIAFSMKIIAYDRSPEKQHKEKKAKELSVTFVSLDELFENSDIISIQTPLNEETRNLIDADMLNKMKKASIIVNVGRGGIINEKALHDALKNGIIAGAASDVFESEPPIDNPLLQLSNFIGTPHIGAQTIDAQRKIGDDIIKIVDAFENDFDINKYGIII